MKTSQHRTVRTTRLLGTAAFAALLAATMAAMLHAPPLMAAFLC